MPERCTGQLTSKSLSNVLRLLATGADVHDVLAALVLAIEDAAPGIVGSVLLLDPVSNRLSHGAAPNLPQEYIEAIDGVQIGPNVGSCGTAAFREQRVIVEEIEADPLWAGFQSIAARHSLRACWSQPIFAMSGEVLGTFAMYYAEPRRPTRGELDLIEHASDLAAVAIEGKKATDAIASSEARFRRLAETVRLIPWEADAQTQQFTYVGRQAEVILGYPIAEWYKEGFWPDHIHPDDRDRAVHLCVEHSRSRENYDFEYRMRAADGSVVWLHDVVHVDSERGHPRTLHGFMIDMTERKQAEAAIHQSDRLVALGTFAAGIAHEINNPLGGIVLAAQRTLTTLDNDGPIEQVHDMLQTVLENSERCGRIVRNVLDFARHGAGERTDTDIKEVIRHAAALARPYAQQERVNVALQLGAKPFYLRICPVGIEQVFVNLLRNGVESGANNISVRARATRGSKGVSIVVQDDGRGMSKEQRARMFDPFYTTRQRDGGSGLGLSITHGIITSHGGTIRVDSELGRGTSVIVELPSQAHPT